MSLSSNHVYDFSWLTEEDFASFEASFTTQQQRESGSSPVQQEMPEPNNDTYEFSLIKEEDFANFEASVTAQQQRESGNLPVLQGSPQSNNKTYDLSWVTLEDLTDVEASLTAQQQHETSTDENLDSSGQQEYQDDIDNSSSQGNPSSQHIDGSHVNASTAHGYASPEVTINNVQGVSNLPWNEINAWPDAGPLEDNDNDNNDNSLASNSFGEADDIVDAVFTAQSNHTAVNSDFPASDSRTQPATSMMTMAALSCTHKKQTAKAKNTLANKNVVVVAPGSRLPAAAQAVSNIVAARPARRPRKCNWTATDDVLLKNGIQSWGAADHEPFKTKKEELAAMWATVAKVFEGREKGAWTALSCSQRADKVMLSFNVCTEAHADRRISWTVEEDRLHRDLRVAEFNDEQTAIVLNLAALGNSSQRNASGCRARWAKIQQGRHLSANEYQSYIAAARPVSANFTAILRMDWRWYSGVSKN